MRWSGTAGSEVGRAVGLAKVTEGEDRAVAALVRSAAGVMGRLVGVEAMSWGSWHARMLRMSRIRMLMRGWRGGEIMLLNRSLERVQAVQDEKQAATEQYQ